MPPSTFPVTLYHNPRCGTSRNVLALIRHAGIEPQIIAYLITPPTAEQLRALLAQLQCTVRDIIRSKESIYMELKLDNTTLTDTQLIDALVAHPILINRPIVLTPLGAKLCRPCEEVLTLLPTTFKGAFCKEDGEEVLDAYGQPVKLTLSK